MAVSDDLRLVLVTPEKILLDKQVRAVRFPMFDGQFGIYPGRAPLVGRLGYGELRLRDMDNTEHSFFIDGGFCQMKGSVISILTDRAIPADKIDRDAAQELLAEATTRVPDGKLEFEKKERDQIRARQMLATARNA